ncbi:4Fe-4S dicluster domain-containing protein [Aminipila terrae]|uniref:4Fe-4S ferredoxin-type domain-containing protein n=1 Tax=Aminipila terrae TaxID=2697030 RepID=A0A6P1MJ02_9FIRM|nr:hypothetical protein [Aminipila terrae]QHI71576.1 hypothetical protein Ami3637_03525 [Aminipila terrae]
MIVMPSNFGAPTPDQLAVRLINILPSKINTIISDILSQRSNFAQPKIQDRFFAAAGKMEHFGAKIFGSSIKASDSCNKCGLCIKNCPEKNISIQNDKIKFGFKCIWCLKCIYGCPCGALNPGMMKSAVIKDGFSINRAKQMAEVHKDDKTEGLPKNGLWGGIIKYLEE